MVLMKLFISNLPAVFTEAHIRDLLEEHCQLVRLELFKDLATRKSNGFALLEVAEDAQGRLLIAAFNGFSIIPAPYPFARSNDLIK
jgi:hypothetical protein